MLKRFVFLMLLFFMGMSAFTYTIKGAVSYTVETARQIAFENIEKKIDMSKHKNYLRDINFESNTLALAKGKSKLKNRKITKFSDGTYSVKYFNNSYTTYYYDIVGNLESIDYDEKGDFPRRSIKYKRNGELAAVALSVAAQEQYVFDASGKFDGHWMNQNGYDKNGKLFRTRK